METNNNIREVKLVIFLDDDDKKKDKNAIVLEEDSSGIRIKLWDLKSEKPFDAPAFKIPHHRLYKIKDLEPTIKVDISNNFVVINRGGENEY